MQAELRRDACSRSYFAFGAVADVGRLVAVFIAASQSKVNASTFLILSIPPCDSGYMLTPDRVGFGPAAVVCTDCIHTMGKATTTLCVLLHESCMFPFRRCVPGGGAGDCGHRHRPQVGGLRDGGGQQLQGPQRAVADLGPAQGALSRRVKRPEVVLQRQAAQLWTTSSPGPLYHYC